MSPEVRVIVIKLARDLRRVTITCPWCDWSLVRTMTYIGSGKHTFRCPKCFKPYRVQFTGKDEV